MYHTESNGHTTIVSDDDAQKMTSGDLAQALHDLARRCNGSHKVVSAMLHAMGYKQAEHAMWRNAAAAKLADAGFELAREVA